jgi:hypothetical protein
MTFRDPLRDRSRPADTGITMHQYSLDFLIVAPGHKFNNGACMEFAAHDISFDMVANVIEAKAQNVMPAML